MLGVFSHDSAFSPPPQPLMDDAGQVEAPSLNASGVAAAVVTAAFAGATEHLIAKGTRDEVSAPAAPQLKSASTLESDTSKLVAEVQYVERSKMIRPRFGWAVEGSGERGVGTWGWCTIIMRMHTH